MYYITADIRSCHAVIFEVIPVLDNSAKKQLQKWKEEKIILKKQKKEITPIHPIIFEFIQELHCVWVSPLQIYDVCNLHSIPHYSLSFETTMCLIEQVSSTHIEVIEYFPDQNYMQPHHLIKVKNLFTTDLPIFKKELDSILNTIQDTNNNKFCNTLRGNKSVSGGLCSQVRKDSLCVQDIDYGGIIDCNKPHFTTTFSQMKLDTHFWTCLLYLTHYSREINPSRFNDTIRSKHIYGDSMYEGITIAILNLDTDKVHPHLDSLNDYRTNYNSCTVLSYIKNNMRLSIIAYAKKSAGDFIDRYTEACG